MKIPYKKQFDSKGTILNPITVDSPYLHKFSHSFKANKYIIFNHPITGEFIGKVKINGNNRKNTCKRAHKTSRNRLRV